MSAENIENMRQLAIQIAQWDKRIVEISAVKDAEEKDDKKLDLICSFMPKPISDTVGFFWIASLMTRMELESLDERLGICPPFDLGFKIGEKVFLPNGKILNNIGEHIVLWPNHEE